MHLIRNLTSEFTIIDHLFVEVAPNVYIQYIYTFGLGVGLDFLTTAKLIPVHASTVRSRPLLCKGEVFWDFIHLPWKPF